VAPEEGLWKITPEGTASIIEAQPKPQQEAEAEAGTEVGS